MVHKKVFEKLEAVYSDRAGEYCEPGYSNEKLALFGNWNNVSKELCAALGEHYELEWSDEWINCEICGKYFRSNPNCYQWTMYGAILNECECICGDCIKEDPTEYIESALNNPKTCIQSFIDLETLGFQNMNGTFENGFHAHMTDDPPTILTEYMAKYPEHEFVFGNLGASQFYVDFEIWGRKKEA